MDVHKKLKLLIVLLILLVLFSERMSAQSVYVPLNHWAYDFVERLEARGLITGALNATKPYSREEMAAYLIQAEEKINAGQSLNSVELEQLRFLQFEFKEEFQRLTGRNGRSYSSRIAHIKEHKIFGKIFPKFLYKNNRNFFNISSDVFQVLVDPIFYHNWLYANPDSVSGIERVLERTHGVTLWGQLGTHLGFFFDFRDTKEWGTRTYPQQFEITREGLGFVNGYGSHIWHDETNAYLVFKLPYMQLILGKDFNYWGPGYNGALTLSNHATSFDQIKLQTKIWRLKFTYLWGFLRTFPPILDANSKSTPKNIVAHRLEINAARWLNLGVHETVIFGNRRFELAYLNPINFYRSAEHALDEDDNATMGFDLEFFLIPNVKLYGEVFIDDLSTLKLGSGFHGNKTAFLTGGLWVDALTIPNLDVRLEYARTRPYLYTHRNDINKYSHFSTGLGHWIGPNADDLFARLQYRLSKHFAMAARFELYRHGDNEPGRNVGGDINQPYLPDAPANIDFLDGIRERRTGFGFEASYEIFRNFYFGLQFNTASSKNFLLPEGTRGPVNRQEFFVNLSLNR
jgi:hypothetical protein